MAKDNSSAKESSIVIPKSERKKISWPNIVVLVILLILLGIVGSYFLSDESKVGLCEQASDCGQYNVFYIKGEGYLCANNNVVEGGSIKTKVLMFKYATKKAIGSVPESCSCVQNTCEVNQ